MFVSALASHFKFLSNSVQIITVLISTSQTITLISVDIMADIYP